MAVKFRYHVLDSAINLAKELHAKLEILHIVDEDYIASGETYFDYDKYDAVLRKHGQKILANAREIAQKSQIEFENKLIELEPTQGRVAEKIIDEAKLWSADLIVIGSHGRRGFNRLLMGSVAESVIRISTIPVLIIRGN